MKCLWKHFQRKWQHNLGVKIAVIVWIGEYNDINDKLELLLDNVKFIDIGTKDLISEVNFEDEELYIRVNPNNKLLRVVRVRNEEYYIGAI